MVQTITNVRTRSVSAEESCYCGGQSVKGRCVLQVEQVTTTRSSSAWYPSRDYDGRLSFAGLDLAGHGVDHGPAGDQICLRSREIPGKGLRNRWHVRQDLRRGNPSNLIRLIPA
jgi:hypothetical protein